MLAREPAGSRKENRMESSGPREPGKACPPSDERPTHSEDGTDLTLIRWFLTLTPAERLQTLQDVLDSIRRLRRGREED